MYMIVPTKLGIFLSFPGQDDVGSSSNTQLVDGIAPIPDAAVALNYGNDLLGNALSETTLSTAHVSLLRRSGQDPLNSLTPSLSRKKRDGNLKSDTTSSSTSLTPDAYERRDRVNGESEVQYGVERKM
jgi:hypothetical protein